MDLWIAIYAKTTWPDLRHVRMQDAAKAWQRIDFVNFITGRLRLAMVVREIAEGVWKGKRKRRK